MLKRNTASLLSLMVLVAGPAAADEAGIDITKIDADTKIVKDFDLDYRTKIEKTDTDVTKVSDSFNEKVDIDASKKLDVDVEKNIDIDASQKLTKVDVDKKEISDSYNEDLEIDASKKLFYAADHSYKVVDSYNTKTEISSSVFAKPVANGTLDGSVSRNVVAVGGVAKIEQDSRQMSDASLSGGALQGFKGINSMNVNGGPNSLQQSNVSIAVVATTSY